MTSTRTAKKTIGLDWQKNNFARASRFFVDFFVVAARLPRETQDNDFLFLFLNFENVLENSNPEKIANICRIRGGISAIKFEAMRLYFLSDVFLAVAVIVA